MAYLLRRTLEDTNLWGEVNVVPAPPDSTDLTVNGRILVSNGLYLELEINVTDATGRSWFKDKFQGGATRYSYEEQRLRTQSVRMRASAKGASVRSSRKPPRESERIEEGRTAVIVARGL